MTAEQKELYNFVTTCEPWKTKCEKANPKSTINPYRRIVREAITDYIERYGNSEDEIFTEIDFMKVVERLAIEAVESPEYYIEFMECKRFMTNTFMISSADIFWKGEYDFAPRRGNALECNGVMFAAYTFLKQFDPETTMEDVYNNISGQRDEGRFDVLDDFLIDDYNVNYFTISGSVVFADITKNGNTICHIRIAV